MKNIGAMLKTIFRIKLWGGYAIAVEKVEEEYHSADELVVGIKKMLQPIKNIKKEGGQNA